jgi:hypothetical protein
MIVFLLLVYLALLFLLVRLNYWFGSRSCP